jgi:hypothetical protein
VVLDAARPLLIGASAIIWYFLDKFIWVSKQ